jgi:hypothetical protein
MFKVGDKVKINKSVLPEKYHSRVKDFNLTYEVINCDQSFGVITHISLSNFKKTWNLNIKYLELDKQYYRTLKLKKICSKLEIY